MWEWSDKLKLGKSSPFVKRDIRSLPLTDAEFEADFFLDPASSTKRQEHWKGMAVERECDGLLAMEDIHFPPPTVNSLASLLFHAMRSPPDYEDRQRPRRIFLRDRPQWQELLPHLRQLGIEIVFSGDLPRFDEAVIDWMRQTKGKMLTPVDDLKMALRKPFPERKRTCFTDAIDLMEWADSMWKEVYPSREIASPSYDPTTLVPVQLTDDELGTILTKTEIAKTKKLRPRLEAMAAAGKAVELDISDWGTVVSALCAPNVKKVSVRKQMLRTAQRIANQLAKALGIDGPPLRT